MRTEDIWPKLDSLSEIKAVLAQAQETKALGDKASKRPWRTSPPPEGAFIVIGDGRSYVAPGRPIEQIKRNSAYIVAACNEHEALTQALADALRLLEYDPARPCPKCGGDDADAPTGGTRRS